jgi:hypothetical protein
MHDVLLGEDVVDEAVLDVDAPYVTTGQGPDELFESRRRSERGAVGGGK